MKPFLIVLVMLITGSTLQVQRKDDRGTPDPLLKLYPDTLLLFQKEILATYPLLMKVFLHVVADGIGMQQRYN